MSDLEFYSKFIALPPHLRAEVADFIEFLSQREKKHNEPTDTPEKKRVKFGLAKGLIKMKDNFDDPIEGFEPYMK